MATGDFWNVDNPLKPWGRFDPDDVIIIPFDFSEWLTEQGTTYLDHALETAEGLEAATVSASAGVILVKVSKAAGETLEEGEKYGVTCQIECADTQKRSMTLYLKVTEL